MKLEARYVVPVTGPAIEGGAVVIRGTRIVDIGPARALSGSPVTDFGQAVIVPGFVNAHTHLELTSLAGRVSPTADFVDWLSRLVTLKRGEPFTAQAVGTAVRDGVLQSLRAGVTLVGDVTSTPQWTREVLAAMPIGGVSFGEVIAIGAVRDQLGDRLDAAASLQHRTERLLIGISPHAPYTVEPEAMGACAARARLMGASLCIHLAETPDEEPFTRSCDGPLAAYLRSLGVWDGDIPSSGCGPVELADRTGVLGPKTVVAHANYVTDDDLDRLAAASASVAYCPRTHHAFGHSPHRFRDMVGAGINVCVGTDSLASNPSLSVLDELRFLRREHPDVDPDVLLAMGTLRGARALGLDAETGSISQGKRADLAVIPLDPSTTGSGWESVLDSGDSPTAVYQAGQRLDVRDGSELRPCSQLPASDTPQL